MTIDLDVQLASIRDYRTRTHFSDAIKCFRAGAYRSSVIAVWIAVVYDLIAKYRELDTLGDAEAKRYVQEWDRASATKNTQKLLELERDLISHAHDSLSILDAAGLRGLSRLREDRHLCAHPAYATEDTLYEPPADLVRAHMTIAVDSLLSQKPIQGRGIFEAFSVDLQSPGFPTNPETIYDYVEQKYLRNMRPHIVRNFGVTLAKSLIRNIPPEWESHAAKVAPCLDVIRYRAAAIWPEVETELIRLINEDTPSNRQRALYALSCFSHLESRLDSPALTALTQICSSIDIVRTTPSIFSAVKLDRFRNILVGLFEQLTDNEASAALSIAAPSVLWPDCLRRFAQASSFRGAENRFDRFILPFTPTLVPSQLDELLSTIQNNGQIWDAGGIPERLGRLLRANTSSRPSDAAITNFYLGIGRTENFEDVWEYMVGLGWATPHDEN